MPITVGAYIPWFCLEPLGEAEAASPLVSTYSVVSFGVFRAKAGDET